MGMKTKKTFFGYLWIFFDIFGVVSVVEWFISCFFRGAHLFEVSVLSLFELSIRTRVKKVHTLETQG